MQEDAAKTFAKSIFRYVFTKCLQTHIEMLKSIDLKASIAH
ncbi:hypothetical protein SZ39_2955 [Bacillus mycoides]|nr:hypothetical protein SZ39_2955 [Bacillus mycoides]